VVAGQTVETTFNVTCVARRVRIINNSNSTVLLKNVVQFKVVASDPTFASGVFTNADLLTEDGLCHSLPGDQIAPGQTRTFTIDPAPPYKVFIGMGLWETDVVSDACPMDFPWFKRTWGTRTDFSLFWVWVAIGVSNHPNPTWDWTITGSYLSGTLAVTPVGDAAIPFNVTNGDPLIRAAANLQVHRVGR
jgi:hypothetical protein